MRLFLLHLLLLVSIPSLGGVVDLYEFQERKDSLYQAGMYPEALSLLHDMKQTAEFVNDPVWVFDIDYQIADLNRAVGSYASALALLNKIKTNPHPDEHWRDVQVYFLKASVFYEIVANDSALYFAKKAREISDNYKVKFVSAELFNLLGAIHSESNPDSALLYLNSSLKAYQDSGLVAPTALVYINMAKAYKTQEDYDKVEEYSNKALAIGREHNILVYIVMAYNNLIDKNLAVGDTEKAMAAMQARDDLTAKILNSKSAMLVDNMMRQLEAEEANVDKRQVEQAVQKANIKNFQKNLILLGTIVILVLLAILLIGAYRNILHRKKAVKQLELLHESNTKILSIISHDLRAPFSQLITILEYANSSDDISAEELRVMNKTILSNAKNGLFMLDNLLYWANNQMEGINVKPSEVDVRKSISAVVEQVKDLANQKKLSIRTYSTAGTLQTDDMIFQIVVRNLLSNAIKFSPIGSEIIIEAKQKEAQTELCITDRGPGIPDRVVKSLLEKTGRVETAQGTFGEKGAGLGLALSKEYAEMIHGNISFNRLEEGGTKAIFSIIPDAAVA